MELVSYGSDEPDRRPDNIGGADDDCRTGSCSAKKAKDLELNEAQRWAERRIDPNNGTLYDPHAPEHWTKDQLAAANSVLDKPLASQFDKKAAFSKADEMNRTTAEDANYEIAAGGVGIGAATRQAMEFKKQYARERGYAGGPWDLKSISPKLKFERYGNVLFGYLGSRSGIPASELRVAAGLFQSGFRPSNIPRALAGEFNGDDPERDYGFVTIGIRSYNEGLEP